MVLAGYWNETKARDWGDEMIERLDNAFERNHPRDYKNFIHYHTIGLDSGVGSSDIGGLLGNGASAATTTPAKNKGKNDNCDISGWDCNHPIHNNGTNTTTGGERPRPSSSTTTSTKPPTTTTTTTLPQFGPKNIPDDQLPQNSLQHNKSQLATASPPPAAIVGLYGMDIVSSNPSEEQPSVISNNPTKQQGNTPSSTLQQLPPPNINPADDTHTSLHAIFSDDHQHNDTYNQRSHHHDGNLSTATTTRTTTTTAGAVGDEHYLALSTANNPSQPLVAPSILSPQASPTAFTPDELAHRLYGPDASDSGMANTNLFHHMASPANHNQQINVHATTTANAFLPQQQQQQPHTTTTTTKSTPFNPCHSPNPTTTTADGDNGASLRKFVNGNSETLPKIPQPHTSKDLSVSLPIAFPSPNPFKWQRHYFVIGDPIDAADYHGLEDDEVAVRHLRDKVKAELELGIQNGLKYQQVDPDRYTIDRWGKWFKSMFGM